jgi:RimJ/RimL family protein N-acetyltransferase
MTPPELRSSRLRLRPLDVDDAELLLPIYLDPEVTWYFTDKVTDLAGVRQLVEGRLERDVPPGMGSWILQRDDTVVGIVHLWPAKDPAGMPEIGWLLGKDYWGAGLAAEAVNAVIEHGFRRLGLPAILALVHRDNAASRRLAAKLGFLDVGEEQHHDAPHRVNVLLPNQVGALHHVELRVADVSAAEAGLGWLLPELGWLSETRWSDGLSWRHGGQSVVVRTVHEPVDALFDGDIGDAALTGNTETGAEGRSGAGADDPDISGLETGDVDAEAVYLYDTSGVEVDQQDSSEPGRLGSEPVPRPDQVGHGDSGQPGRTALALSAGSAARVAELTTAAVERGWQLLSIDRYTDAEGPGRQVVYLRTPDGIDIELVGDEAATPVFDGFGPGSA